MSYWVKIIYDRNIYAIDLDRIGAFSASPSGKITFWLPDSKTSIVITAHSNPQAYQQIQEYINKITNYTLGNYWLKLTYDRDEYMIDLNRIGAFSLAPSGKLTFWISDSGNPIIIHPQGNAEAYQKIIDYVEKTTGYSLL